MGGEDKGLVELAGHPLVEYVLTAVAPQAATVLVSANRHRERYASFGYPVVADRIAGYPGPLAGIASALEVVTTPYLLTVPCDAPLVPPDLTERLYRALVEASAELSVAHDGERSQPVFALVRRTLLPRLLAYLESGGRGVGAWHARLRVAHADFSGQPRAFLNVNTPEERAALERRLGEKTGA
jgi:molybdenum cofactor guanylyltransferase